jgi:putative molybdenum carrier protein
MCHRPALGGQERTFAPASAKTSFLEHTAIVTEHSMGKYSIPKGFKIVSGGQTGADQAGLDWAIAHGIRHGGWCPKGRKTESGILDSRYSVAETPSSNYLERTEWNVRDSDATVIFTLAEELSGGSKRTEDFAKQLGKPCFHFKPRVDPKYLAQFLERNNVVVLNVAGSRESSAAGIGEMVARALDAALELP